MGILYLKEPFKIIADSILNIFTEWVRLDSSYTSSIIRITETYLYNFYPLKPHFHIVPVKLGFTFSYFWSKHRFWVLVKTPSLMRFKRVPTIYVLSRNMKNIRIFIWKLSQVLVVKFSVYLNRCVFVMVDFLLEGQFTWNVKAYFLGKSIWECQLQQYMLLLLLWLVL